MAQRTQGRDLVEVTATFRMGNDRSIAVWDGKRRDGAKELWVWIPRRFLPEGFEDPNWDTVLELEIPEWLAMDRKLI